MAATFKPRQGLMQALFDSSSMQPYYLRLKNDNGDDPSDQEAPFYTQSTEEPYGWGVDAMEIEFDDIPADASITKLQVIDERDTTGGIIGEFKFDSPINFDNEGKITVKKDKCHVEVSSSS